MLGNLKSTITELAYTSVSMVEESLNTATGKEKKAAAVDYIVSMLPIPTIFKSLVGILLSKTVDESIEKAVEYMHKVKTVGA